MNRTAILQRGLLVLSVVALVLAAFAGIQRRSPVARNPAAEAERWEVLDRRARFGHTAERYETVRATIFGLEDKDRTPQGVIAAMGEPTHKLDRQDAEWWVYELDDGLSVHIQFDAAGRCMGWGTTGLKDYEYNLYRRREWERP